MAPHFRSGVAGPGNLWQGGWEHLFGSPEPASRSPFRPQRFDVPILAG